LGAALETAQETIDGARRSAADARVATAGGALAGQLRAVAALLGEAVDVTRAPSTSVGPAAVARLRSAGRVSRHGARGARVIAERMRANLTWASDGFQHALRLAVVVTLATAVAHAIGFGRGYWLALTAVLVLRPEFSVTFTRGLSRAVGTFVGVGVATVVALLTHPHGWALVALVGGFVAVAGALFNASYAVFSVAVTGAVVFLLAGLDANPTRTARDPLLATVLGAAIALGLYAVWPAWGRRRGADTMAELADATPQLNVLQRVGGSIGTAVLAVVLQRALTGVHTLSGMASAYGTAFWASAGLTAVAIVPSLILLRAERAARAAAGAPTVEGPPPDTPAEAVAI